MERVRWYWYPSSFEIPPDRIRLVLHSDDRRCCGSVELECLFDTINGDDKRCLLSEKY